MRSTSVVPLVIIVVVIFVVVLFVVVVVVNIVIIIVIITVIIISIVRGALFSLCRGTNIYNSLWGAPKFQGTYHGFIYFLLFLFFLSGFLYCWCERNTGRHFIGFY